MYSHGMIVHWVMRLLGYVFAVYCIIKRKCSVALLLHSILYAFIWESKVIMTHRK